MTDSGPYRSVDILEKIDFLDALVRLQGMLGHHVKVELNDYESFFGCGFEGSLLRIETVPGEAAAISVFISGSAGFFLDPEDCKAYAVDAGEVSWLEFHRTSGPVIAIQALDASPDAGLDVAVG
jgi:hypothetical protein